MRPLFFLILASLAAADPLPPQIQPAPTTVEALADEDGRKVWNTRFFRIDSDQNLRPADLARIAQVADTTALAVRAHPLPLFSPPRGVRARISIHSTDRAYEQAGGPHGTSGYYSARDTAVFIHGGYFFRPPAQGAAALAPRHDEDLVVHEIVHLCMHHLNRGLPHWFIEGLAEYFASAHTGGGRFSFADMDAAVRRHLRARLNPADPSIPLVPVADVIDLDGRGWNEYVVKLPAEERYRAYATSLLLVHRHLHGGPQQLDSVRQALESAARTRRPPTLIARDAATSTEDGLIRYWRPKGLAPVFRKADQ